MPQCTNTLCSSYNSDKVFKEKLQETGMLRESERIPILFHKFITLWKTFLRPEFLELSWFFMKYFLVFVFKCSLIAKL